MTHYLTSRANGVFRWAALQIEQLGHADREKDVRRALKRLPEDLQKTYERMLQVIEQNNKVEEAFIILRWIAFAKRSLTLAEIAELAAFDVQDLGSDKVTIEFEPRDRFPNFIAVQQMLSGLVSFDNDTEYLPGTLASFAHFSVREYLESSGCFLEVLHLKDIDCHSVILQCCLAYLSRYICDRSNDEKGEPYPLLIYAHNFWESHASTVDACNSGLSKRILAEFLHLFHQDHEPSQPLTVKSKMQYALDWDLPVFGQRSGRIERNGGVLLRAAHIGHARLVKFLLDAGPGQTGSYVSLDEKSQATPVHTAAFGETLKESYLYESFDLTKFQQKNHVAIVRQLLAAGFDCNATMQYGFTPLHIASVYANQDIVEVLLKSNELDVNLIDNAGHTAVCVASEAGHADIVSLLLRRDAERINHKDWHGRTPLGLASLRGHEATVRVLLRQQHIDVNLADDSGRSPLALAASRGEEAVLKALLSDPRTNRHSSDNLGLSPLAWSIIGGHDAAFRLILSDDESTVHSRDHERRSVLHHAKRHNRKSMEESLSNLGPKDEDDVETPQVGTRNTKRFSLNLVASMSVGVEVWHVVFSRDGRRLVALGDFPTAFILDVSSKQVLVTLNCVTPLYGAAWSPDDSMIVTHGHKGSAILWDSHVSIPPILCHVYPLIIPDWCID